MLLQDSQTKVITMFSPDFTRIHIVENASFEMPWYSSEFILWKMSVLKCPGIQQNLYCGKCDF